MTCYAACCTYLFDTSDNLIRMIISCIHCCHASLAAGLTVYSAGRV